MQQYIGQAEHLRFQSKGEMCLSKETENCKKRTHYNKQLVISHNALNTWVKKKNKRAMMALYRSTG